MLENKLLNDESLELTERCDFTENFASKYTLHKITESSTGPNQPKSQIIFRKKRPSQDFVI